MRSARGTQFFLGVVFTLSVIFSPFFVFASKPPARPGDPYINVGQGDYDADYQFTANIQGAATSPTIHFGWLRSFRPGTPFKSKNFKGYQIQYLVKSRQYPQMTQSICAMPADATQWGVLDEFDEYYPWGGKISRNVKDARNMYNGEVFFRIVGVPHPSISPTPVPLTCRTDTIRSLNDSPIDEQLLLRISAIDGKKFDADGTKEELGAKVLINGKAASEAADGATIISVSKPLTPTTIRVANDPATVIKVSVAKDGYEGGEKDVPLSSATTDTEFKLYTDREGEATTTDPDAAATGGSSVAPPPNPEDCNQYIGLTLPPKFELGNFIACQLINGTKYIVSKIAGSIAGVTTNPWDFIREQPGKPKAIITIWRVVLGLVDFVVVGGLLIAAFANIFRFKLDNYEIKKILPGLIIGIVLANLSFFIMRLFIESASIIAQFIGNIISGYMPGANAIGNASASSYLVTEAFAQLMRSLFEHNPWFAKGTIGAGNPLEIAMSAVTVVTIAQQGILLGILFLLFMLVPIIFIVILIFLLYLRNYILVALFMLSPFAFFSLGFPPLRNLWMRWWKTFWQWLIMLPTVFAVLGLGVLFLYFMNRATERSMIDFFFVNGVAIAIFYFAMRIPFMWGDFFGFKATDQWAKLGSKGAQLTHTVAKKGTDLGIEKYTQKYNAVKTAPAGAGLGGTALDTFATSNKLKTTRYAGETDASFRARINTALAEKDKEATAKRVSEKQNKGNVFRYYEGARAGLKARMESEKAGEEYNIKQNALYRPFAGPKGVAKDIFDKAREEAGAIDDYAGLSGPMKELHDHYVNQMTARGYHPDAAKREAAERMRSLSNLQFGAREGAIANDEFLKGIDKKKIQQGLESTRKWTSLANRDNATKTTFGASTGAQAAVNALVAGNLVPFGTVAIDEEDLGTIGGGGTVVVNQVTQNIAPQSAGASVKLSNQLVPQDVIGAVRNAAAGNLSPDDRDTLGVKRHSAITAAKVMAEETERALRREMGLRGFGPEIGNRLLETIYKGVKKGEKKFLANEVGIPFEQLVELEPQIKAVSGSYKAMKQVMDIGRPEDGSSSSATSSQIAVGLAKENKQAEMESKLGTLMTEISNPTTERGRLEQIHRELNVPPTVLNPQQVQTTDELRSGLTDWAQKTQAATVTLRDPQVQAAVQTYQASPTPEFERSLKEAISSAASQKELISHTVTDLGQAANEYDPANPATSEQIAARVAEQLRTTARLHDTYRPTIQYYEATGQESVIDQSLSELAKRLLGEVQTEARSQTDVDGAPYERPSSYVADPRYHETLYQKLENALVEGFSKVASPPEAAQPAPAEPQV